MAERDTHYSVINSHYKKRCPVLPEKLKQGNKRYPCIHGSKITVQGKYEHFGGCKHDKNLA